MVSPLARRSVVKYLKKAGKCSERRACVVVGLSRSLVRYIARRRRDEAELVADTDGEVKVRIDGQYLAQALKACGGMVEFKLANAYSPMLFIANGYQLVVMPMLTTDADKQAKADREAKAEAKPTDEPTEPKAKGKGKGKGKGKTEPEPVTA